MYIPVKAKLAIAAVGSIVWLGLSIIISQPWLEDLAAIVTMPGAIAIITGIAFIPGLANAFILISLLMDKRPAYDEEKELPPVTILIAAYNEEYNIIDTLDSVLLQKYPNDVKIIVIDDGSTDDTQDTIVNFIRNRNMYGPSLEGFDIELIWMKENSGKSAALNCGLDRVETDVVVTIDADSYMFKHSLRRIVSNLVYGPPNTAAVAGSILTRNSRKNWITRLQEWDYFLGIAVVKRVQSLYQGTMVAQGAFSVYSTAVLNELGGWSDTVGEDIVLTWAMHEKGYRVGYSEDAFVFTNVPETFNQFYHQRKRWARGLVEAFKAFPGIFFKLRPNTPFVYLNVLFPLLDLTYVLVFIPGVIAALFFDFYAIVGIMTLLLIPLALMINWVLYAKQRDIFTKHGLRVRRNIIGLIGYMFVYQLILAPACLVGYFSELFNFNKNWGTK